MKLLREFVGAACLCALVSVSPAQAATYSVMTFDGIPESGGDTERFGAPNLWIEDGITATGGGDYGWFGYHRGAPIDTAHMDDSGTTFPSYITFTMNMFSAFNAVSFDILPLDNYFCIREDDLVCGIPFDNILLTGLRGGVTVAEDSLYMGTEPSTYLFGAEFSKLDSLVIALLRPDSTLDGMCIDVMCSHMNIENVTLSPVPLPPAIVFFISALGLMVAFPAMKRRRSRGLLSAA